MRLMSNSSLAFYSLDLLNTQYVWIFSLFLGYVSENAGFFFKTATIAVSEKSQFSQIMATIIAL